MSSKQRACIAKLKIVALEVKSVISELRNAKLTREQYDEVISSLDSCRNKLSSVANELANIRSTEK